jgi:hypothetical protein
MASACDGDLSVPRMLTRENAGNTRQVPLTLALISDPVRSTTPYKRLTLQKATKQAKRPKGNKSGER